MRAFAIAAAALLLALAAAADTAQREVMVDGYGGSPQEAVANALAEAVRQVNGVSVDANVFVESMLMRSTSNEGSEASVSTRMKQGAGVRGSGLLAGYDVLSNTPSDVGYTANVRARVLRYAPTGIDSAARRKLAVIPRASLYDRYEVFGVIAGDDLADRYTAALEAALVQSRRFAVIDRSENAALARERTRWRRADAPLQARVQIGRALSADYLLFTRILDASGGIDHQHITITGEDFERAYASFAVEVRVVLAVTGEVKFAETLTLGVNELGERSELQSLIGAVADRVAALVTERIYPLQIIGAENDEYILNQGGRSVVFGERFRVVQRGKALTDPYTHESLGFAEEEIAQIEVTRVDARVAYARLAEGSPGKARKGMMLKRIAGTGSGFERPQPAPGRNEGVRLPFDR